MTMILTRYSKVVADETGNMGHQTCAEDYLRCLESRVNEFKEMFVYALDERCDSTL